MTCGVRALRTFKKKEKPGQDVWTRSKFSSLQLEEGPQNIEQHGRESRSSIPKDETVQILALHIF